MAWNVIGRGSWSIDDAGDSLLVFLERLKLSEVGFEPTPPVENATWTHRLRPLGHPDLSGLEYCPFEVHCTGVTKPAAVWTFKVGCKTPFHALAGNRTRASRVAGENSTTEPPMPVAPFLCPIGNLGLGFVSSFFSMQDIGYPPLDITMFVWKVPGNSTTV